MPKETNITTVLMVVSSLPFHGRPGSNPRSGYFV